MSRNTRSGSRSKQQSRAHKSSRHSQKGGKGRKTYKKMIKRSGRSYKRVMQHGG